MSDHLGNDDLNVRDLSDGRRLRVVSSQEVRAFETVESLMSREFPPLRWLVDGLIPEGLTLLAGRPKIGKSWLALDLCLSAPAGQYVLGRPTEPGPALYLALEDSERRLQARCRTLLDGAEPPSNVYYATEWPRLDQGGLDELAGFLDRHPDVRLVVVDTLAKVKPSRKETEGLYASDYAALDGLQKLASDRRISVIVVTHVRKTEADDPIDQVSGSLGLTAAVDTILVLNRANTGTTLYGRGRDVDELEVAVSFDKARCRWESLGPAEDVHRSDERGRVLTALYEIGDDAGPADVAACAGMSSTNVRQLLLKMAKAGEVVKRGRGRYVHPEFAGPHECPEADGEET